MDVIIDVEVIIKVCGCCGRTFTQAQWDDLGVGKFQRWPWQEVHQFKNCSCNSTIVVIVDPGIPDDQVAV